MARLFYFSESDGSSLSEEDLAHQEDSTEEHHGSERGEVGSPDATRMIGDAPFYVGSAMRGGFENCMNTSEGVEEQVYSMVLPPVDDQLEQEDSQGTAADTTVGSTAKGATGEVIAENESGTVMSDGERGDPSQRHQGPGTASHSEGRRATGAVPRRQLITTTGEPLPNPPLSEALTHYLDNNVKFAIGLTQERSALADQMMSTQFTLLTSMKELEEKLATKFAAFRTDQKEEIKYLLRKELIANNRVLMKRFDDQLEDFRQATREHLDRIEFKTAQAHVRIQELKSDMREHVMTQQVMAAAKPVSSPDPGSQAQRGVAPDQPTQPPPPGPPTSRTVAINPEYPPLDENGNIPRKSLEAIKLLARGNFEAGIFPPGAAKDHQIIIHYLGWHVLVEPGSFNELDTAFQKADARVDELLPQAVVGGPLQRYLNLFSAQLQRHQANTHRRAARAVLNGIACGTGPVAPPDEGSSKKKTTRGREYKRKLGFGKLFNVEKALHPWTEATAYQEVIKHCREGHGLLSIGSFSAIGGIYPFIVNGDYTTAFDSANRTVTFEADPKLEQEGVSVLHLKDGDNNRRVPQEVMPPSGPSTHRGLGNISLRPSIARGNAWTKPLCPMRAAPRGTWPFRHRKR